MTCLEYIRQLPGCEYKNAFNLTCPHAFGLEEVCPNDIGKCGQCWQNEATIDGNPAPYLFACPVKPGQTVYCVFKSGDISEDYIRSVSFIREYDGESYWECYGRNDYMIANSAGWMINCFPTREAAENKLEELKS